MSYTGVVSVINNWGVVMVGLDPAKCILKLCQNSFYMHLSSTFVGVWLTGVNTVVLGGSILQRLMCILVFFDLDFCDDFRNYNSC